jgi:hypothetical protein
MIEPMWPGESLVHYNARTRDKYTPYCCNCTYSGRCTWMSQFKWSCPQCKRVYESVYVAPEGKEAT